MSSLSFLQAAGGRELSLLIVLYCIYITDGGRRELSLSLFVKAAGGHALCICMYVSGGGRRELSLYSIGITGGGR